MKIAYEQVFEIVSKGNSFREDHGKVLSLVIESGDKRIHIEDIVKLTGWYYLFILNILKELERVGVVRSEATIYTKWYMLTEEA